MCKKHIFKFGGIMKYLSIKKMLFVALGLLIFNKGEFAEAQSINAIGACKKFFRAGNQIKPIKKKHACLFQVKFKPNQTDQKYIAEIYSSNKYRTTTTLNNQGVGKFKLVFGDIRTRLRLTAVKLPINEFQKELEKVANCTTSQQCTQIVPYGCGCHQNLVINEKANPEKLISLIDPDLVFTCECKETFGTICKNNQCQWNFGEISID
jgi:hypothetical protein